MNVNSEKPTSFREGNRKRRGPKIINAFGSSMGPLNGRREKNKSRQKRRSESVPAAQVLDSRQEGARAPRSPRRCPFQEGTNNNERWIPSNVASHNRRVENLRTCKSGKRVDGWGRRGAVKALVAREEKERRPRKMARLYLIYNQFELDFAVQRAARSRGGGVRGSLVYVHRLLEVALRRKCRR